MKRVIVLALAVGLAGAVFAQAGGTGLGVRIWGMKREPGATGRPMARRCAG